MPTRDRRNFIPRVIACFLSQTYTDSELIILDDGIDRVEDLIPHDRRVRYYHSQFRRVVGAKRNMACQAANGDVIAHWDDDDWSHPERLATQIELLKADPDTHLTGYYAMGFHRLTDGKVFRYEARPSYAIGTSFMYWRGWWRSHQFLDMQKSEDNTFLGHVGRAACVDGSQMMVATVHKDGTCDKDGAMDLIEDRERTRQARIQMGETNPPKYEWSHWSFDQLPEGYRRVACLG